MWQLFLSKGQQSISKIRRLIIADQPNGKTELQHELRKFSASIAFFKDGLRVVPSWDVIFAEVLVGVLTFG